MRRPPIPRAILCHRAELYNVVKDRYRQDRDVLSARLRYIRIDADLTRRSDKDNTTHSASMVLFFDCRNSLPAKADFRPGQAVHWNGARYIVQEVEPVYDDQALHHYEVKLEGG